MDVISRVTRRHKLDLHVPAFLSAVMAGSKFAYVRKFELPDALLPNMFMVFRLDGHSFHRLVLAIFFRIQLNKRNRFSDTHKFAKPNDDRALKLMDHAALDIMTEYPDIVLGFGESDEFRCYSMLPDNFSC